MHEEITRVRQAIGRILDDEERTETEHRHLVSANWRACRTVLRYLRDLSPENLSRVRLHTELFTGENLNHLVFDTNNQDPAAFARSSGYLFHTADLPDRLRIGEPPFAGTIPWAPEDRPAPPGFPHGCTYEGRILNHDLVRVQGYVGNLARVGLFDAPAGGRTVFFQMGAGYGAVEHHLLRLAPGRMTCIIVDLPLLLLVSAAYIVQNTPGIRVLIHEPDDPRPITDADVAAHDLILMPHYRLDLLEPVSRIDFAMNALSLQEMTPGAADAYLDFIAARLTGSLMMHFHEWPHRPGIAERLAARFAVYPTPAAYRAHYSRRPGRDGAAHGPHIHFCGRDEAALRPVRDAALRLKLGDGALAVLQDGVITE